ncbi:hypothetical protein [Sorangium cellulosum]|uniref:hypothetical protein n=1 Tax=Sorangium cellulosum TaxID=56 RepID=UPI0013312797|nr:hypothetical protein [Sorangium cellulosum]
MPTSSRSGAGSEVGREPAGARLDPPARSRRDDAALAAPARSAAGRKGVEPARAKARGNRVLLLFLGLVALAAVIVFAAQSPRAPQRAEGEEPTRDAPAPQPRAAAEPALPEPAAPREASDPPPGPPVDSSPPTIVTAEAAAGTPASAAATNSAAPRAAASPRAADSAAPRAAASPRAADSAAPRATASPPKRPAKAPTPASAPAEATPQPPGAEPPPEPAPKPAEAPPEAPNPPR